MTKVTAIFENGVFRPTKPIAMVDGTEVELSFDPASRPTLARPVITTGPTGLPLITPPAGTPPITNEDVARALDDE